MQSAPSAPRKVTLSTLPPLASPDVARQTLEATSGICFVALLVLLLWACTEMVLTDKAIQEDDWYAFSMHVGISLQAAFAMVCLGLLVSDACGRTRGDTSRRGRRPRRRWSAPRRCARSG